ncbi:DNA repair protein rad9 [Metarhizium anisopliae]
MSTSHVLAKKPLMRTTSIAVETDEFDDIDVEDKLHVVISVKDFRATVQHAGITGNAISARYSLPAKPILLSYAGDALACEASASRIGAFDLRPSQKPPPPTIRSESLFVDDDGWEPVRDEEEDVEQDARLEWDHSADPLSRIEERHAASVGRQEAADAQTAPESTYLEPTQKLSDVKSLALFPD